MFLYLASNGKLTIICFLSYLTKTFTVSTVMIISLIGIHQWTVKIQPGILEVFSVSGGSWMRYYYYYYY